MLTEKDYCDYETCAALKELGYNEKTLAYYTSEGFFHWVRAYIYDVAIPDLANSSNKKPYKHIIDAMSLYEAQKWLREEKGIEVVVLGEKEIGGPYYADIYTESGYAGYVHKPCEKYEEALSEGVRASIKILQDEQKENN